MKEAHDARKLDLNLIGETKWTKVTSNFLSKYMEMMDLYFSFIKQGKIKVRIKFQATSQIVNEQSDSIQQYMGIFPGAMAFRLNDMRIKKRSL